MDTLRDNFREGNSPETIEIQGSHSLRALEHTHFLRNIKALTADFPDVPSLKELGCFSFCVRHAGSCDSGATKQQKL